MAEILVGLVTVFESLFNTAALTGTFTGTLAMAGASCLGPATALAATAGFAILGAEFFTALASLLAALTGVLTAATELLTDDTPDALTVFLGSGCAFDATVLTAGLVTFFGAAALPATTLAGALAATFETGLTATFAKALAAGFAVVLAAALVTVLFALLVVVIFGADPNFRLAAFFSVAPDFVKIFFAFEATRGFAGFFML